MLLRGLKDTLRNAYDHSELIERPIVRPSPLSFTAGLGIQRLANIGQVFKRQCRTYCLSFVY
jgi:hypothetical protein